MFKFSEECMLAFQTLKERLESTLMMVPLNWSQEFELMYDANDYVVGAMLGKWRDKVFHSIYYASKVLNDAQLNYATTRKKLLAVV